MSSDMNQLKGIESLPYNEIFEILYHLQRCVSIAPNDTRSLLQQYPEFTKAIAQAQLRLGMIQPHENNDINIQNATTGATSDIMEQLDPEQQELLEQVQNLAPEVIQSLPPDERRQIMELREAMGLPAF